MGGGGGGRNNNNKQNKQKSIPSNRNANLNKLMLNESKQNKRNNKKERKQQQLATAYWINLAHPSREPPFDFYMHTNGFVLSLSLWLFSKKL